VYMLRCRGGDLYTGYALEPEKRTRLHNRGVASKFTRARLPVKLVHVERFASKSEALRREIAIKKLSRQEKLKLIRSGRSRIASQDPLGNLWPHAALRFLQNEKGKAKLI
jgi:putative endonuclease